MFIIIAQPLIVTTDAQAQHNVAMRPVESE
jgi:hypothetical protein